MHWACSRVHFHVQFCREHEFSCWSWKFKIRYRKKRPEIQNEFDETRERGTDSIIRGHLLASPFFLSRLLFSFYRLATLHSNLFGSWKLQEHFLTLRLSEKLVSLQLPDPPQ